ncbi:hypothetical protein HY637_03480, partial [Candidatus Woesearchaeota archaeon]|nr:hypothetical protein [Candidatus Woesearchaeota archaeon]
KEKEKLESEMKKFDGKVEQANKPEPEEPKSSDKPLIIGIALIIIALIAIISYSVFYKEQPKTLEDLHVLNLQGKLKPEQGYVYNGVYSFVKFDNVWHVQLKSPKGTKVYSMALRYSPREVQGIVIEGNLDRQFFDNQTQFYATFNPTGNDFSMVALAVADFEAHMTKVFEKFPIGACDRNETYVCIERPIVTCSDTGKLVLYVRESQKFRAYYNNNCIVVEGNGFDLVKGVDRILYNLYGLMEQEEI